MQGTFVMPIKWEQTTTYRANDDGEPNSAGMPIYGQIQSFELLMS
jgi:putative IMPACT (imprinted ancient) family translation regulator